MKANKTRQPNEQSTELQTINLQLFALTLLLATPSRLQAVWLDPTKKTADWEQLLNNLGFVDIPAAVRFMARLKNRRMFFEGVGTLLRDMKEEYPEPPPHPPNGVDTEIVRRLGPNPCV